jgi:4-hydroxy-tetrahydrodipicolinate synthase
MFEGLTVAMVTPFRGDGLDLEATERLVEFLIAGGTEHLVVSGSTGEAATCSVEERRSLWRFVKERARGRVSVIAGTGTNSTSDSIALTKLAEELGLDGALVVTPYYNKPTPRGQIAHFTAVAKATRLPIMIYNVPGRTGTNTMPETLAALGALPNVVAVKEASGSVDQASAVRAKVPYTLLSGDDSLTLPMIAVGAAGIVSVAGNVVPELMRQLTDRARAGRMAEAEKIHARLLPLFKALFVESNPGPVKFLLSAMGMMANQLRLPLVPVEPATQEIVLEAARSVGVALGAPAVARG